MTPEAMEYGQRRKAEEGEVVDGQLSMMLLSHFRPSDWSAARVWGL